MKECLISESSLRFSQTIHGTLALTSFLLRHPWVALATSILMILGVISTKINLFYQLHRLISKNLRKKEPEFIRKDCGEVSFACGLGGSFLLIGFLLLYFGKFANLAWGLIVLTSALLLFAGIVGICTASLTYAFFKQILRKNK